MPGLGKKYKVLFGASTGEQYSPRWPTRSHTSGGFTNVKHVKRVAIQTVMTLVPIEHVTLTQRYQILDGNHLDLRIPADTMVTGAMLAKTPQSMIYQHLTNSGQINRKATQRATDAIKAATKEIFGETPTEKNIWASMRHKDITHKIRDFLWKHAHGIYRLGKFWTHIPGYESRAECPICNKYNTLAHIISECDSEEQATIWESTNELWR